VYKIELLFYFKVDKGISTVTTKVKGIGYVDKQNIFDKLENFNEEDINFKVFDTSSNIFSKLFNQFTKNKN
jgi:hypothetical protein